MNEGVRVTRMGQFGDTTYTKVFVGGLAWETQKETMRRYFEQFGEILEAVVITDKNSGRSKGYGFVTFKDPESATRACQDPSPIIDGRRTNCNLASLGAQRPRIVTPDARYRLWSSSSMPSYHAGAFQLHHHGSSSATSYYHLGATHPTFSQHTPPYFHQGFPYYGYASYSAPDSSFHPNFYGAPQAPQMYAAAPGVMTNPAYYPYFQQGSGTATPAPSGGSSATSQNYGINPYPQPPPLFHYGGLASATHISNVPHHHHQPFISLPQSTGMTLGLAARFLYSMPPSSAASMHSGSTSEHS